MLSFIAHRITRFLDIIVFVQLVGLGTALKKFWSVETLKKKIAKSKVEVHAGLYFFPKHSRSRIIETRQPRCFRSDFLHNIRKWYEIIFAR